MKKFYLLIMSLVAYTAATMAQPDPDCPLAVGQYFNMPTSPSFCKVFLGNLPAGEPGTIGAVTLIGGNGLPIPDINGNPSTPLPASSTSISISYGCQGIQRVEVDFYVGTELRECTFTPIAGGALPIKLSSFNGRLSTETEATLAWTSSLEENSFQYEVQRSADGKNFVTVGKVTAAGTSLDAIKYSFKDPLPANGSYWYRLNMIDIDGKSELSKVVYVNSKKGSGIITKVFPNPFTSEIQLIGATSADLTSGNIRVFNVSGQQIRFRIVGANAIALDENAPKGMYFLKFRNKADQEQILKLMKN
ncbi:T9SS type A sorting domain-containing protein [Longitalea luteola]|uniref:T9SS type A sorting domain-containing protein n=1 Tax=Longitalea luteola TaxID=2812563 RepID=UPI001A975C7E|nr:T9SS type A sorting domain-containing protein [Longitalea luteola]